MPLNIDYVFAETAVFKLHRLLSKLDNAQLGKVFDTIDSLNKDINSTLPNKSIAKSGRFSKGITVWECGYCDLTFDTQDAADKHEEQCLSNPKK